MIGDCRELLRTLPNGMFQTCVTSPPYWGLRDYGNDGQMGLESTPENYVEGMVAVFREVRRVLRDNGTLWLNLGDSYAAQRGGTCMPAETLAGGDHGKSDYADPLRGRVRHGGHQAHRDARAIGLKHKDLVGIPWRVAFALQADGWYLRQDIIWHKPNPMPESVTDRCTKAHEYIFMLSKSARYYYDNAAIKEPAKYVDKGTGKTIYKPAGAYDGKHSDKQRGHSRRHAGFNDRWDALTKDEQQAVGANKRSVWTVVTKPFKGSHFATFPPDLIEPCVLAGSRPGDIILDPFGGSGTTAGVALRHGRNAVLCELNPEYAGFMENRISGVVNDKRRAVDSRSTHSAAGRKGQKGSA